MLEPMAHSGVVGQEEGKALTCSCSCELRSCANNA
jgi:hypothetical protein